MCSPYSNERVSKKVQEIRGGVTETGAVCDTGILRELKRDGDI